MNKIDLVIDMQINSLRFSNFILNSKSIVLLTSNKITTKQKSLTSTHILKRSFTISQLSLKSLSFSQFNEKSVKLIKQLKSRDVTLTSVKISKSTSGSTNIAMIETATYRMLVNVEIMSRSFNQRDLRLICMYCSLEIAITRH